MRFYVLWYTLSSVVEEWPFQHPCIASIFSSKIKLGACSYSGLKDDILFVHNTGMNCNFFLENMGDGTLKQ